ncbi:hypothetical protein [Paenibacillus mendelii]|uniref:Uncharacterized protein n=1 Tax=Paenibacillus mendelii TaxID=206163 RepID=A0ABV6JL83_9BACL|nr:hypothetical protein [Paenibacillus mendelii]MCQ6564026.1 hypothetical protein [Paenibacillus mendelii]
MRKLILTIATVIFMFGVLHIVVTPITYQGYTIDDLWFASFGLALIFLAFINYVLMSIKQRQTKVFVVCHAANMLCTILVSLLLTFALAPHIIILFVLLVLETLLVIRFQFSSNLITVNPKIREL